MPVSFSSFFVIGLSFHISSCCTISTQEEKFQWKFQNLK